MNFNVYHSLIHHSGNSFHSYASTPKYKINISFCETLYKNVILYNIQSRKLTGLCTLMSDYLSLIYETVQVNHTKKQY